MIDLDPLGTQNRFHQTFLALVRALLERQPLVLFLDDLQWVDAASLRLHPAAGAARPTSRACCSWAPIAARTSARNIPWPRPIGALRNLGAGVEELTLSPLGRGEHRRFCADALQAAPERAHPLAEVLVRKTAGNPFFLERLLRFLQKTGLLHREASGTAGLGARRDRAGERHRQRCRSADRRACTTCRSRFGPLLGAAASIGRTMPLSWLAVACGQGPEEILPAVRSAVNEGYLVGLPSRRPAACRRR